MSQQNPINTAQSTFETTFFGKVMAYFALAVFASLAGTYVTTTYFLDTFVQNPALMYVLFAVELGIIFTSRWWSQKVPLNRLLFFAFAFITGVTIAPLVAIIAASEGGLMIINKALLTTVATFAATAIVGYTTKRNLSFMGGFLTMALIGMIITAVIGIFIPWSNSFELIYSGLGVLLFSAYTMYDFQKLKSFPQDRHIDAALMLYLDIFNLFLFILRFMAANRD